MRLALFAPLLVLLAGCGAVERSLVEQAVAARVAAAGFVEREATVDGRPIAYLERGGSRPALVLVHGFGAQKESWADLVAALPEGRRVLALDLPGHGDSPAETPAVYGPDRYADDVLAWLDALGTGPVHLGGSSMGGHVVSLVAARRPGAVRSLILVSPAGLDSPEPSRFDAFLALGENPLIPTDRASYDEMLAFAFEQDPGLPGAARDVFAEAAAARAPFLRRLFTNLRSEPDPLAGVLPTLDVPSLVVWGEADRVLDVSAGARWRELLGARLVVLPDVGHAPMMEAPEALGDPISDFLAAIGDSTDG